jgi:cobalt-zinc-cadmium efflux system outer membrane protein
MLALLAGSALPAQAADPAADPDLIRTPALALRWADVAAAVERHPLVLEAEAGRRGAAGLVSAAGAIPNPILSGSTGDARPRGGGAPGRQWSYTVGLPLDFLATRGSRVAAAEAGEEAAHQEAAVARSRALRELRRAFVAAAHGQAVLQAAVELEEQAARLAELVRRRAERGEARPTEVPRIEIEHERLRGALDRARAAAEGARLDAARRELAAGLGEAWQACSAGQATVRRFQEEILPRAERSARALGRAFELGEAGLLDVIDSRRTLLDTRREALDAQLDMQTACGDLAALAGLEIP